MKDDVTIEQVYEELHQWFGGDHVSPMLFVQWLIEEWDSFTSHYITQQQMPAITEAVEQRIKEAGF